MSDCPCGSEEQYDSCCGPFHKGSTNPGTAEETMRSRYSAFVKGEVDYILDSHHEKTRGEIKREEVESWSKNSEWNGLEIRDTL